MKLLLFLYSLYFLNSPRVIQIDQVGANAPIAEMEGDEPNQGGRIEQRLGVPLPGAPGPIPKENKILIEINKLGKIKATAGEEAYPFFSPDGGDLEKGFGRFLDAQQNGGRVTAIIKVDGDAPLSSVTSVLNGLAGAQISEVTFTDMFEKNEGRKNKEAENENKKKKLAPQDGKTRKIEFKIYDDGRISAKYEKSLLSKFDPNDPAGYRPVEEWLLSLKDPGPNVGVLKSQKNATFGISRQLIKQLAKAGITQIQYASFSEE